MIVCATPRCGGTIFCIEKAAETGARFVGELSPDYITGIGRYGSLKQANHETSYQPQFALDDYIEHLGHVHAADRIYLVNEAVSLALPWSSFRIATRDLDRGFRSMADLVIRSMAGEDPDTVFFIAARFCWTLLESNTLITRYCELTGKPLVIYEDHYTSKGVYPNFDAFAQRDRLEQLFVHLGMLARNHSGCTALLAGFSGIAPPTGHHRTLRPGADGRVAGSRAGTGGASQRAPGSRVLRRRAGCETGRAACPR